MPFRRLNATVSAIGSRTTQQQLTFVLTHPRR